MGLKAIQIAVNDTCQCDLHQICDPLQTTPLKVYSSLKRCRTYWSEHDCHQSARYVVYLPTLHRVICNTLSFERNSTTFNVDAVDVTIWNVLQLLVRGLLRRRSAAAYMARGRPGSLKTGRTRNPLIVWTVHVVLSHVRVWVHILGVTLRVFR